MTRSSHSSPYSSIHFLIGGYFARIFFVLAALAAIVSTATAQSTSTAITLTISPASVTYQTPITLTATVTASDSSTPVGIVLFCQATAKSCESNSALSVVQLTKAGTASLKLGSGPVGNHSYIAIFRGNNTYATSSTLTPVSYTVTGIYTSAISLVSTGSIGNYSLAGTVDGVGSLTTGPTGTISFLDVSAGSLLGTENLVVSNLFTSFSGTKAFNIGISPTKTKRSVAIASAYLDADNNLDVVTADQPQPGDASTITVLLGNGDGTFKKGVPLPGCNTGESALQIILADFDRDGNTDVALGCSDGTNGGLIIILGDGTGKFPNPVFYPTGDVADIAMGDFNNDGFLDIAVTDKSQKNLTIFLGKGDGAFTQQATTISTPALAHDLVVADFNHDGNDDIAYAVTTAVSGSNLSDLYVALGNGDGTFNVPSTPVATQIGEFLTTGDTDADNNPDIVSSTITEPGGGLIGNSLFVLLGKGDGTFQTPVAYQSDIPSDPHLADVNGDGIPDIIAGGSIGALVYQGVGNGTFALPGSLPGTEPVIGGFALTYAINAGDFNNDGNADLIGTDADTPRAAVSLSQVNQISAASALTKVAVLPPGTGVHNVDASYSGDGIYVGSLSNTVQLTAVPVNTSLALTVSPNLSILAGEPVTLTAVLDPFTVSPPTTTTDGELVNFFSGTTPLGPGTLSGGVATLTTSALPTGADSLSAVFPGDSNYNSSTSNTVTTTVTKVQLSSSVNPSTYTQSVTFTATLPTGKTGTVAFFDGTTNIGSGTISGITATLTTSTLSLGSHNITAKFGPDTSNVLVQVVNKATPTVTVTTSPQPSTYGDTVTITASVPAGATGTIIFTSGSLALGTGTVTSGSASVTTTALTPPSDLIVATYSGDSNYTTAVGNVTQNVAKATPTTTLTSSLNPSPVNTAVTFTDTLPSNVTGTVTFTSGGSTLGSSSVVNGIATLTTSSLPGGGDLVTATYNGDTNFNSVVATLTQNVNKSTPTVTVSTSGPSIIGQTVTITASVPVGPTGSITLTSGGVTLGAGNVTSSNGTVIITTTVLPVGSDLITATYGGDAANNSATGSVTQTVSNKATPVVALISSANPSLPGQAVTFTATLPTGVTGTVTFTSGSTPLGTFSLAGVTASVTTSSLPIGADPITATYNGDGNNNSASGTLTQNVAKTTPTVLLTSSPNPSNDNQAVTFMAALPTGVTGTVNFIDGSTTLGSGTINNGVATFTTSTLSPGVHVITAGYVGDTNNNAATSAPLSQTVNKATPVLPIPVVSTTSPVVGAPVTITETVPPGVSGPVTFSNGSTPIGSAPIIGGVATITVTTLPLGTDQITASTPGDANNNPATSPPVSVTVVKVAPTVSVTSSQNPSIVNQPVTFTATAPAGATGTITFFDGSNILGTGTLNNGQTTLTTSTLIVGSHTITVSYGGDTNNNPATSVPLTQIVNKASPVIPPPVVSSSTPPPNTPVTITETVPPGVTGTVTFSNGTTPIGTGTIVNGTATITVPSLPLGTDPITATTSGDANNNPATSGATIVTVTPLNPVLVAPIVSSNNPPPNTPVTITEPIPTGVSGPVSFFDGTTLLGTATIVNGQATLTVPSLPIGVHPITVTAINTTTSGTITSPPTQVKVAKVTVVVTLTSSVNPSAPNQSVTFSASIPATATGSITFLDGTTILGAGPINAGIVTFTTSTLTIGSHSITASYGGDSTYSSAASAILTQVVSRIPTVTTIVESAPAQLLHTGVTFTANVTAPSPNATGTVTFMDGTVVMGSAPISANGGVIVSLTTNANASFATTGLVTGAHQIVAVYSGDNNFAPSTSAPATNMVEDFTNTNTGPASQNMFPGATTTYNFTLAPVSATTFINDVTVAIDGLPQGSTYTFTPSTIKAGSGSTQIVLSVQTSSSLSARNHPPQNSPYPRSEVPIALGMLGIAGLGTLRRLRHKIPRSLMLLLLALGSLLPIAALSGCAGGYFTLTPTTYSLTVTGSEGVVQHAATATLIVQ